MLLYEAQSPVLLLLDDPEAAKDPDEDLLVGGKGPADLLLEPPGRFCNEASSSEARRMCSEAGTCSTSSTCSSS